HWDTVNPEEQADSRLKSGGQYDRLVGENVASTLRLQRGAGTAAQPWSAPRSPVCADAPCTVSLRRLVRILRCCGRRSGSRPRVVSQGQLRRGRGVIRVAGRKASRGSGDRAGAVRGVGGGTGKG